MTWTDRLKEAAYTSPSRKRYTFEYENVSNSRDKKTTNFEFPDVDGTYVQESGSAGRSFPLRCIFWGADYDQDAAKFDAALFEAGTGKLEHPIYGTVDVVPTGTISRRDDLKTAANQAIIEVTFMSTIGLIYPSAQTDPASEVLAAVAASNTAKAAEFEKIDLDTEVKKATFKNGYTAFLDKAQADLAAIADVTSGVRSEFNAINDSINRGIDVLIGQPLTLAFQTEQFIQAPGRSDALIKDKLNAYKNLAESITLNNDGSTSLSLDANDFALKTLYAMGYVTGSVVSAVNTQFDTRSNAVTAASEILEQFYELNTWADANITELGAIDTGAAYQQLQAAVALTAGYLVEISFTLKQERRVVLDRARTIVDLTAELYGDIDDNLDFLIESNDLSGSEILELPKGKEVVYYV
jgi:prophage DNA circulation protein